MIEERAIVTATRGAFAQVETTRQTSCGSCEAKSACGTSALAKLLGNRRNLVEVLNPIGAVPGDRVIVGVDESILTRVSFLFYILPLFTLFGGALLGQWLAEVIKFQDTEPLSILCGLLGLASGLFWLKRLVSRNRRSRSFQAVILRQAGTIQFVDGIH
ncbi:MAG: SoxR reducing system RseC family protein [Sedimenticola sp.]|nr:SoxR reducing system RseC family protein [Sedimenticola sp.]